MKRCLPFIMALMLPLCANAQVINDHDGDVDLRQYINGETRSITIDYDDGGWDDIYLRNIDILRRTGVQVRIRGTCVSACTFYLSLGRQVCYVGNRAQFDFHINDPSDRSEHRFLMGLYPRHVRNVVSGAMRRNNWTTVRASRLVRPC